MKLQCPKCNTINIQTAQFCNGCGIEFVFDSNMPVNNRSSNNFYKYLTAGLISFLLTVFAVYVIASPYSSLWSMKSAAENKDAETFSSYIDFPKLRENLKAELNAKMLENVAKDDGLKDNPFSGLALAAAPMMINNMVDAFVSPQGIEKLFKNATLTEQDLDIKNPADSLKPNNYQKLNNINKLSIHKSIRGYEQIR